MTNISHLYKSQIHLLLNKSKKLFFIYKYDQRKYMFKTVTLFAHSLSSFGPKDVNSCDHTRNLGYEKSFVFSGNMDFCIFWIFSCMAINSMQLFVVLSLCLYVS